MATTTPPRPGAPPPREPPPTPARAARGRYGRPLAIGALAVVVLVVALLVFGGGNGSTYKLEFAEGDQLVRGNQVQVGGVPVGSVTNLELTHDFKAIVTIHVNSPLAPLHAGTTAQVRVPSLSSVANRFVALSPGPNNAPKLAAGTRLPASATKQVTDLDQLFNTLDPKTRKGLSQFIQGTAETYVGQSKALGGATEYFAPSLTATDHFFSELVRDQSTFTKFLVETAKAVTTIGARKDQLAGLIENADTTFTAVGEQQSNLARGLKELPIALRQGNRTFAELPPTFRDLKRLVDASKPTVQPLTRLFTRLEPLVKTATPVVTNFSNAFSRPGPNNDLTDYINALPRLAKVLETGTPAAVRSLQESIPITAFFGPYSPDLQGTLRNFGQTSAYYDANGHYARLNPLFPDFALGANNTLKPTSAAGGLAPLKSGQLRRCPGAATQPAADGSSPFTDGEALTCDPTQHP
ncbi:MAG: phospholipid/cholesterol/gamma-HCH transport system substrate-binding protein [Solirubrobacteraceae bacterium]|jgi:phospholipid/cholesterol/gamma-HCH transport system substrate-binding protein|nr:phospholipid/cholesterol/gamma-HCH transport system substrate-binding protein [Solirubrobacteraceae bacterium]